MLSIYLKSPFGLGNWLGKINERSEPNIQNFQEIWKSHQKSNVIFLNTDNSSVHASLETVLEE